MTDKAIVRPAILSANDGDVIEHSKRALTGIVLLFVMAVLAACGSGGGGEGGGSGPASATLTGMATMPATGSTNISASSGNLTSSNGVLTVDPPPAAPIGVFAVSATGQATVSWSASSGAESYNLYWGTDPGITTASTAITGVSSPYVHTGLSDGNTYYYRVSAVNAVGETLSEETFTYLYVGGNPTGTFSAAGSMATPRAFHTATLLHDGKVLVVGGYDGTDYLASASLYDPAMGSFTPTLGSLGVPRQRHTATKLLDGKVLVVGGIKDDAGTSPVARAELYDPATGNFIPTGLLVVPRFLHTATLLPDGKVLVAGGSNATHIVASAELYDPATGNFTPTGAMTLQRGYHAATLLADGKVLVMGGARGGFYFASAELYDPATGIFTPAGAMAGPKQGHTATLLPSGKVLVAGGNNGFNAIARAELYDPATATFDPTVGRATARFDHTATLLPNGEVMVTGGHGYDGTLDKTDLYDPVTATFRPTGIMTARREVHTATLLHDGKVLVVGGYAPGGIIVLDSAELFQ